MGEDGGGAAREGGGEAADGTGREAATLSTEQPDRQRLSADGIRGASLADRINRRLHRLSWRSPLHRMRLRGRYPLQLIDVPADPVPGRRRAGLALLEGAMLHGRERIAIVDLARPGASAAFAEHAQSFGWLRDLAAATSRDQGAPVAEAITRLWLARHARTVADPAWRPDLWGRRILMWTAYAPFLLSADDADYRKALLNTLARGARHLDRAADSVTPGLPRIAAWSGVIAAGLLIPGGDLRTAHGEAGLVRALGQGLHDEGGLATRVPAMQLDLVELMAQLRAVYEVRARPLPPPVAQVIRKAAATLAATTLGDGALSSWQGGGPIGADRVAAAIAGCGVRPEPPVRARDWGYQRVEAGAARLLMDAAPPPAGTVIRGGCASTLAFEFSDGAQRLVVNCGGAPGLPAELAHGLRTTAAHSTLTLAETNSTSLHDDGSLGRGVTEVELERVDDRRSTTIDASHDGYVRRHGFRHRRRMMLAADGRELSVTDELRPAGRRRGLAATPFVIRLHLAPGIETTLTADAHGVLMRTPEGAAWRFRAGRGHLTIEPSMWIDASGRGRGTVAIHLADETPPDGVTVDWSLSRMR